MSGRRKSLRGFDLRVQQALKIVPEDVRNPVLIWLALIAFIFFLKLCH